MGTAACALHRAPCSRHRLGIQNLPPCGPTLTDHRSHNPGGPDRSTDSRERHRQREIDAVFTTPGPRSRLFFSSPVPRAQCCAREFCCHLEHNCTQCSWQPHIQSRGAMNRTQRARCSGTGCGLERLTLSPGRWGVRVPQGRPPKAPGALGALGVQSLTSSHPGPGS